MPRSSPFPISLSAAEAAELRRRSAKYTLPYFQVQRAKIILMAAEGLENIAARLTPAVTSYRNGVTGSSWSVSLV
jgi:hypothetical protein